MGDRKTCRTRSACPHCRRDVMFDVPTRPAPPPDWGVIAHAAYAVAFAVLVGAALIASVVLR